jgi:hypothetical protein
MGTTNMKMTTDVQELGHLSQYSDWSTDWTTEGTGAAVSAGTSEFYLRCVQTDSTGYRVSCLLSAGGGGGV